VLISTCEVFVYTAAELSESESGFEEDLQGFIEKYIALWRGSAAETPILAATYTAAEQQSSELQTGRLTDSMEKELRNYPGRKKQQSSWRERMFAMLREFGKSSLRYPDRHLDIIFSPEYFEATKTFISKARAFDPKMETEALAQALRNVWVMNCLQMFLGRQPSLSPSIFAYSMLYPYTDNYLDRPELSIKSKEVACRRLGLRLSGEPLTSRDDHEAAIFRLVEMIEGEFPRDIFTEVYSSLLAIHAGQIQSLSQQHPSEIPDDQRLLRISVAKGGSSVLADGWLVAGTLAREEADFFFGYGVMLQLLDDLQDLPEDRAAGHWTLFTRTRGTEHLESLTNRLWAFMHGILNSMDCFTAPRCLEIKELIRRSSTILMLRAIAECDNLFSREYLHHMERISPLRFAYLKGQRKEISDRFRKIWPGVARRRRLQSVFDLLG
jgi:hypothetical protein